MADESIPMFAKDPGAIIDFDINWSPTTGQGYLEVGETITVSTWTRTEGPADLIISGGAQAPSIIGGTRTKVFVEAGTAGNHYALTNHITTSLGRQDERTIRINCYQR